jgi:hypothetical protein
VEERITRLESDVIHIRPDMSEMKSDLRELRKIIGALKHAVANLRVDLHGSTTALLNQIHRTQIGALLLARRFWACLARGFHWI